MEKFKFSSNFDYIGGTIRNTSFLLLYKTTTRWTICRQYRSSRHDFKSNKYKEDLGHSIWCIGLDCKWFIRNIKRLLLSPNPHLFPALVSGPRRFSNIIKNEGIRFIYGRNFSSLISALIYRKFRIFTRYAFAVNKTKENLPKNI